MKNDIVKAVVGVYILGSKVNDVVKIEDVKGYYSERLTQLNSEIQTSRLWNYWFESNFQW